MRSKVLATIALCVVITAVGCGGGASSTKSASVDMVIYQVEEAATISGTVFFDGNSSGIQDSGEPGIEGVAVALDDSEFTTTDSLGFYSFSAMAGTYGVSITVPTGLVPTTPATVAVPLGDENVTVNFGLTEEVVPTASIYGTVFADDNGNGLFDSLESGIPGVTVTLDGGPAVVTDALGGYAFAVTAVGLYTVTETDPENAVSTTPNSVEVAVTELGAAYRVDFGDMLMVDVDVDVKPGSDVNPINLRSRGVLPVAIMGSEGFDVTAIDPSSILLEGVGPLRWSYEDVCGKVEDPMADPLDADPDPGEMMSPDGFMDLTLKFETQAIAAAIGDVARNDIVTLTLTGSLTDGSPITGEETVRIVQVPKD